MEGALWTVNFKNEATRWMGALERVQEINLLIGSIISDRINDFYWMLPEIGTELNLETY